MTILDKINQYIQQKSQEIEKILNPKLEYAIDFYTRGKTKQLGLYFNKKLLVGGDYHFYGVYQASTQLWIWATSIPGINLDQINHINKIRSFAYLFEANTTPQINFYYQLIKFK